jgi:DNA-binding beta-propeller fold protein YncE
MLKRKGLLFFVAAICAVFFVAPTPAEAQFKHDFLYKFQSRWTDIAVSTAAARIFIVNDSYSRIEEYNSSGILQAIHGGFGTGSTEFNRPQGIAIDSDYTLYVLDTGNNRVVHYTTPLSATPGTALGAAETWGSYGSSDGQFNNPTAIAISTDSASVYIADTDNNRVQKCTTSGACTSWGSIGIGNGKFSAPRGITFDNSSGDDRVYVADTGNNRIQWFDTSGTYSGQFGSYSQFILPYRIATETTGNFIYVMDTLNRIQRVSKSTTTTDATITLDSAGAGMKILSGTIYVTSLPTTFQTYGALTLVLGGTMTNDIGHPVDMALDTSGNIYMSNNFTSPYFPVIQKFNSSFVQQAEWHGNGEFGNTIGPLGFGINSGNDWFVADTDNNSVQKFASVTNSWAFTITGAPTPFIQPRDVAVEPATGNIFVSDTGNSRITKHDSAGNFILAFGLPTPTGGGPTPLPGSTPGPFGITIASDNKLYIADAGYSRIQRFDANGNYEASWGMYGSADSSTIPQMANPQGMSIDSSGNIYVADTGNNRIERFDQAGTLATRVIWGSYGSQDGNFINPRNVCVDSSNKVYVSEMGELVGSVPRNRRIQVFGDGAASAGLTITQTNGTTVSEGLTADATVIDSYTVKLNTQPSASVLVTLTVSDPTQATVTTPVLAFTPYNWNIPQTVTVVPTHDYIAEGTHSVVISHKPGNTTDDNYKNVGNISWADVTVTINDTIDTPGVTFSSNTVPWATEGATLSNAYSIVLNTKPTSDVTITLTPDSSISLTQSVFTFTSTTYATPQFVQLTPVHDFIAQGTHTGLISHVSSSSDLNYASPNVPFSEASGNVTVTIQDNDAVGVTVSKSTVNVTENGATDTYTVKLNSKPTSDVEIYPTDASPSALVDLSPSTLTFTDANWSTPQTVTVTAVHDFLQNPTPTQSTLILHDATFSLDPAYDNINVASVSAIITDSDTSGLLVFRPGGGSVTATEGGAGDTYAFQLTSIPSANVTVTITSTDNQATTSAYFYTFTPTDWDVPQYATVSAIDDSVEEGTHYGVLLHTLASADTNFDGKTAYETVTITDNDAAGITITLPNGAINIAEAGPSDSYFVKLNSQPSGPVTLVFDAQNQATASPTNLVFDSSNWNINQEVVITAIQDYIIEGAHTATVSYTGSSADTKYSGKTASFTANISDDDTYSPGLSIVETDGGTYVVENKTTDTYTITLTSKPTANVKVKIVANGPEATTSAGVYWFTPSVWNVPQTVIVSAKSNPSSSKTVIFSHLLTSLDVHYNDYAPIPTVNVTVSPNSGTAASGENVKAPGCSKTAPYDAPQLFQITTTKNEATLYFVPVKENISYYFIAYGFTPGDQRFGTSFEMGPQTGAIGYTVSMLDAGTQYYFSIRGGNGCATGPWSSYVPATTVGADRSSQTTYNFYGSTVSTTSSGSSSSSSSSGGSSPTGGIWLTRDLYPGSQGADVRSLQEYLNARGFTLASSGPGSPGNETTYYGNLTAAAVRRFQEAHFAEILSPLGYASGTGICGPSTRSYINSHP